MTPLAAELGPETSGQYDYRAGLGASMRTSATCPREASGDPCRPCRSPDLQLFDLERAAPDVSLKEPCLVFRRRCTGAVLQGLIWLVTGLFRAEGPPLPSRGTSLKTAPCTDQHPLAGGRKDHGGRLYRAVAGDALIMGTVKAAVVFVR